jgi:hypothetical protein
MSVFRGRRLAAVGARESYTITRPAPTENTGLTTVLPATEPGTSQIIVTVASGDFYLPTGLVGQYIGVLLAQVLNNDGATRTVSYRMIKNGASVSTGSVSVSTTQRGRIQGYFSPTAVSGDNPGTGLKSGDVIELRLWSASSTNVQLVYWTYFLIDSRTKPTGAQGVRDCSLVTSANYPALASWPGGGAQLASNPRHVVGDDTNMTVPLSPSTTFVPRGITLGGYGLIQAQQGDSGFNNAASNLGAASPTYIAATQLASASLRRVPVV